MVVCAGAPGRLAVPVPRDKGNNFEPQGFMLIRSGGVAPAFVDRSRAGSVGDYRFSGSDADYQLVTLAVFEIIFIKITRHCHIRPLFQTPLVYRMIKMAAAVGPKDPGPLGFLARGEIGKRAGGPMAFSPGVDGNLEGTAPLSAKAEAFSWNGLDSHRQVFREFVP